MAIWGSLTGLNIEGSLNGLNIEGLYWDSKHEMVSEGKIFIIFRKIKVNRTEWLIKSKTYIQ